ncbi:MAG TPA: glycoside hydrolase family 43 protein [Chryseosolibacter sp.]|nr:glycoside hydrolase family 43 protein [Chryseosolibacter sp.]
MNPSDSVYLFSYFKGHGDGLHLAWSADGFRWNALRDDQPLVTGHAGPEKLMRDPFLFPARDGLFHLVWTAGWRGKGIGYTSSFDLLHWSDQTFIGVMEHEPDALNCWAPEIFFDEDRDQYVIYWATSIPGRFPETDHTGDEGLNHRMYYACTKDFKTFSETRLFFDAGFNVIDATLAKDGDRYLLFLKDETLMPCQKNIRVAMSGDIYSGFGQVSEPMTGDYWAEGPTAIRIDDAWIVYFDKYKLNQIGAVMSRDLVHWKDISSQLHFPDGAQHGSVVKISLERIHHLL